ncbi:Scr1 family TA system antitoxin-like transcriptional regulator [Actinokineospora auranticolor]|uniref:Helix-turn-helix protein n=1 Tax=Actinokineospora auranticolor TaxID=155976 RepID=A0A2S6GY64_9PSEU|nr:Scr1 family TA system antitoxin-like transcriptional regulator [Actinokineospora auranticolor]PPK70182.1 helix-turn-helix protein [Actinokineospora auranticolor]
MAKGTSTMPRVFLGVALHQLRVDAGISLETASRHIGKSRQRLMYLEEGCATLTADELTKLAEFLGAEGDRLTELEALGVDARKSPTGDPYTDLGPESWRRVAYLEAKAQTIQSYENGVFPALLQSADYAEALIRATEGIWQEPLSDKLRRSRAAFRLERQRRAFEAEEAKRVSLYFTEDTFNQAVGSPEVMHAQGRHILDLAELHDNLDVRVIPATTWDNPAQRGGLSLFGFSDLVRSIGFLSVLYGPSTYMNAAEDTARMSRAFKRLDELALGRDDTLTLIAARVKGFS